MQTGVASPVAPAQSPQQQQRIPATSGKPEPPAGAGAVHTFQALTCWQQSHVLRPAAGRPCSQTPACAASCCALQGVPNPLLQLSATAAAAGLSRHSSQAGQLPAQRQGSAPRPEASAPSSRPPSQPPGQQGLAHPPSEQTRPQMNPSSGQAPAPYQAAAAAPGTDQSQGLLRQPAAGGLAEQPGSTVASGKPAAGQDEPVRATVELQHNGQGPDQLQARPSSQPAAAAALARGRSEGLGPEQQPTSSPASQAQLRALPQVPLRQQQQAGAWPRAHAPEVQLCKAFWPCKGVFKPPREHQA